MIKTNLSKSLFANTSKRFLRSQNTEGKAQIIQPLFEEYDIESPSDI